MLKEEFINAVTEFGSPRLRELVLESKDATDTAYNVAEIYYRSPQLDEICKGADRHAKLVNWLDEHYWRYSDAISQVKWAQFRATNRILYELEKEME